MILFAIENGKNTRSSIVSEYFYYQLFRPIGQGLEHSFVHPHLAARIVHPEEDMHQSHQTPRFSYELLLSQETSR
jgi:hypothetical protein